jgi:hypothetical protein
MSTIEELAEAKKAAHTALHTFKNETITLKALEARRIDQERTPRLSELAAECRAAIAAYDAAARAAGFHPLEGRKVWMNVPNQFSRITGRDEVKVYGIVKVHRGGPVGTRNQRYFLPYIGDAYIVFLKTDGTPGARVAASFKGDLPFGWHLDEESSPVLAEEPVAEQSPGEGRDAEDDDRPNGDHPAPHGKRAY